MEDIYLTFLLPNNQSFIVLPNKVPKDINLEFWDKELTLAMIKKNSYEMPEMVTLSLRSAIKNPYPKGVSEIEIVHGLARGINYKTFLIDSQGLMRIKPSNACKWYKVLGLSKRATCGEILYRAGRLVGLKCKNSYRINSSIRGMKEEELTSLYEKLKEKWSKSYWKIWKKIKHTYFAYLKLISNELNGACQNEKVINN